MGERLFTESGYEVRGRIRLNRKVYSGTHIRKLIIKDGKWEKLVPQEVAKFIREIDGINRLKDLAKSDK